jgi:hypothetical protein
MKTQNTTFFQALGKTQLSNLVKEVKETVAITVPAIHNKTAFSIVHLWGMNGSRRSRFGRRHTGLQTNLL